MIIRKRHFTFVFSRSLLSDGVRAVAAAVILAGVACSWSTPGFAQTAPSNTKWDQPPALVTPTNIYFGWNEVSVFDKRVAADDWVCTTTNPVVKIRWWGSFIDWTNSSLPPVLPAGFKIHFWTDVPKGMPDPFSHPGQAIWEITTPTITPRCVGQDFDPRTGRFETCYLFEWTLSPQDWFYQEPLTGTNIYWLSIAAVYPTGVPVDNPFGWKTRPRDLTSPAPDAAVGIDNPNNPAVGSLFVAGAPIIWPASANPTNEWDLAFELVTADSSVVGAKWEQPPDLTPRGMDVNDSQTQTGAAFLLADDFQCTASGYITNIVIWGSWLNDLLPVDTAGIASATNVVFLLSIHADIPAAQSPTGYSMPGALLWQGTAGPGKFSHSVLASNIQEGWMNPPTGYVFPGDTVCHQYDIRLGPNDEPFFQSGSPTAPQVYWLDVQAVPQHNGTTPVYFGWKSSSTNWNDAAVWVNAVEPYAGIWNRLVYPPGHPSFSNQVDLAFRLNTETSSTELPKWSQPPVLASNPGNWFDGWNEPSIYGGGLWGNVPLTNIVADDWLCTNPRPVSDIHWWGSFLNWMGTNGLPPQPPIAFRFTIWTDVAQGPNEPFSHPGRVLWEYLASTTDTSLRWRWAGWDVDPRSPCAEVESCFEFDYKLPKAAWFLQEPGTNTYWLSIAAMYPSSDVGLNPFGWKTRPHVPVPPDDAVRIFEPLAPGVNLSYVSGEPIEYPAGTSWDMAFRLTTCQQLTVVTNIAITNITVTNILSQQLVTIRWNAQSGIYYQMQHVDALTNRPTIPWSDVGPMILGPANTLVLTNPALPYRFYRLVVPDICP